METKLIISNQCFLIYFPRTMHIVTLQDSRMHSSTIYSRKFIQILHILSFTKYIINNFKPEGDILLTFSQPKDENGFN